jgi:alkylhydroperoxidase family enzyme
MTTTVSSNPQPLSPATPAPYLAPIEKPKGLRLKLLYRFLGRAFGKPPGWLTVVGARMPFEFMSWSGKVYKLGKKLELSEDTMRLVRARVDNLNGCAWCMDAGRWYAMTKTPHLLPKLDTLHDYRTSALFDDKERAALDFATELTETKHVGPETFSRLSRHYSEREICDLVWVVATNHLFNLTNRGLGIGSDGLCELSGAA